MGAGADTNVSANTAKRDTLIHIEKRCQAKWREDQIFEVSAPSIDEIPPDTMTIDQIREQYPKFLGSMAYPYLNGTMHAGHGFTASKIEFATAFARMQGQRTLFPLGFHCTGMPIKAGADKIAFEVDKFGKQFEGYQDPEIGEEEVTGLTTVLVQNDAVDVTRFGSTRSKAVAKTGKAKYQFQIMMALGIPKPEVHKFAESEHWLDYFPPVWIRDLDDFGAGIDWRRQFVTTDANPYYDTFVRWQMNRLRELNKILYGNRYTIYSPEDGQPCMDHDRTDGEGVQPQEYTAIKLEVKEWSLAAEESMKKVIPSSATVFFVAATLRPETVYGQTCCFVNPTMEYGVFKISEHEYFIATQRAVWNMAFQGILKAVDNHTFRRQNELQPVATATGRTFIGSLVHAPFSLHNPGVRVLPMDLILPTKGTGVVIAVPSDSPDDYVTIRELTKKFRHFEIEKEWTEMDIVPIMETPTYGSLTAPHLVDVLKITSPRDASQLTIAKNLAYKEGHYKGKMLVGDFQGEAVLSAKEKIRNVLISHGYAFPYVEPEDKVVSRSGYECVVAYLGQWFMNYGANDPQWRDQVSAFVSNDLKTFAQETRNQLISTIQWLNQWACARTYGLGSRLPWDSSFLVESLSDSTIYQSYYTVAHLLHQDRFGKQRGIANVTPEQLTDEVWDCILAQAPIDDTVVEHSGIPREVLQTMRREFEYWYPLDLGVTGKDLVPNHVTFFLYNHIALFPQQHWPQSVRSNGHLLLNGSKMSKSTGNFLTLHEAIKKYGADAVRISFADAGDSVEDANFEETVANSSILRLFTLKEWCEEYARDDTLRSGPADTLWDRLFEAEMYNLVHDAFNHYKEYAGCPLYPSSHANDRRTHYKSALRSAFYEFSSARDFYREACHANETRMHIDLVRKYINLQALIIAPIVPHWAEYVWTEVLDKATSIRTELWPAVTAPDLAVLATLAYIRNTCSNVTSSKAAQEKRKAKGRGVTSNNAVSQNQITLFVATQFSQWQQESVNLVRDTWDPSRKVFDERKLNMELKKVTEPKKSRHYIQNLKQKLIRGEDRESVLSGKLDFDEMEIATQMTNLLARTTHCRINIVSTTNWKEAHSHDPIPGVFSIVEAALPGQPSVWVETL